MAECCICCPPAVSALLCLWCQSGCSKGTVAGALTFFPPDPPLYQFQRQTKDGRILAHDEEATVENEQDEKDGKKKSRSDDEDDDEGVMEGPSRNGPLDAQYRGQANDQMKSPIEQLTDQAAARRRRAKERAQRDAQDIAACVTYKILLDPRLHVPPHDHSDVQAVKIPCRKGASKTSVGTVAAVVYRVPQSRVTPQTKTLIYSHGNATDLGAMFPLQVILATSLDCHVVVYDYSGYGESGGIPDEHNTYKDIEDVYEYVYENVAEKKAENIVLYGQSVGSGPCCYLSSKSRGAKDSFKIGGMVLHSPFTSGMRVLTPSRALACLDIYPNVDRITKVNCPVMIIHGEMDQEVDVSHGQDLYDALPDECRYEPWWVPDRGHNDITDGPGKLAEYVRRIRRFLKYLDDRSIANDGSQ